MLPESPTNSLKYQPLYIHYLIVDYPFVTLSFSEYLYAGLSVAVQGDFINCSIPYEFQSNTGKLKFRYKTNRNASLEVQVCAGQRKTNFDEDNWTPAEIPISCSSPEAVQVRFSFVIIQPWHIQGGPIKRNDKLPVICGCNNSYQWMRYLPLRKIIPRSAIWVQ